MSFVSPFFSRVSIAKVSLFALVFTGAPLVAATREDPVPIEEPGDYNEFLQAMVSRENLADCIEKMDAIIDRGERMAAASGGASDPVRATTKNGLIFAFSPAISHEAVAYTCIISRGGQELNFTDATKLAALFGDRVGLPHPVIVTANADSAFTATWLIKPNKWKAMKAMMLKVRAKNRENKNPQEVFANAVLVEIEARKAAVEAAHTSK